MLVSIFNVRYFFAEVLSKRIVNPSPRFTQFVAVCSYTSGQRFEVRRLNVEGPERLIQTAHHLELRSLPLSHDLEHAGQAISCGVLDHYDAHVPGRVRHRRFASCNLTNELAGHAIASNGGHIEYPQAGIGRDGMLLDSRITVCQRLIGELPLNPNKQDFIHGVELELEAHANVTGKAKRPSKTRGTDAAARIVSLRLDCPRTVL